MKGVKADIVACKACPRLVSWRQKSAAAPPKRFQGETYWKLPVPGFGDIGARLLVVGLAPAAHGGNRTGRVFTGDSSGDFLFRALFAARFASQAESTSRRDGLKLKDAYVAAAVRCAPPDNRPTPKEFERCQPFLVREIRALGRLEVVVALGSLAWTASLRSFAEAGYEIPQPTPPFSHGAEVWLGRGHVGDGGVHGVDGEGVWLLGSYHVSRQNTNTGRLTAPMLDEIFRRVRGRL